MSRHWPQRPWQPIDKAPKDGTAVLVFTADCVVAQAFYGPDGEDEGEWRGPYSDGLETSVKWSIGDPTHWMPLPPPPTIAGEVND